MCHSALELACSSSGERTVTFSGILQTSCSTQSLLKIKQCKHTNKLIIIKMKLINTQNSSLSNNFIIFPLCVFLRLVRPIVSTWRKLLLLHAWWLHNGSLESTMVGVFTPRKWANAMNQGGFLLRAYY